MNPKALECEILALIMTSTGKNVPLNETFAARLSETEFRKVMTSIRETYHFTPMLTSRATPRQLADLTFQKISPECMASDEFCANASLAAFNKRSFPVAVAA